MRTLYLFGNGFDIAHGINTPYSSFRAFLSKRHEDFLRQFEELYHIQPLDDTEPWYTESAQKRWEQRVLKDLWRCFEEEIGNPDVFGMHDLAESLAYEMPTENVKDTLDVHWREQYSFSKRFQKYVLEWLETIDTSKAVCKKRELLNNGFDSFMNFNYTDTLERVYGIKNVLHIHGGVPTCSTTPPIMGHGNKQLIDSYRKKAQAAQDEFIEWEESVCNAIADYCETLYKDTNRIILRHEAFFSSLHDIEQVICLGLSWGKVDTPYLVRIQEAIMPTAKWVVYYYDSATHDRLKEIFGELGISNKHEVHFLQSDSFWDK